MGRVVFEGLYRRPATLGRPAAQSHRLHARWGKVLVLHRFELKKMADSQSRCDAQDDIVKIAAMAPQVSAATHVRVLPATARQWSSTHTDRGASAFDC